MPMLLLAWALSFAVLSLGHCAVRASDLRHRMKK